MLNLGIGDKVQESKYVYIGCFIHQKEGKWHLFLSPVNWGYCVDSVFRYRNFGDRYIVRRTMYASQNNQYPEFLIHTFDPWFKNAALPILKRGWQKYFADPSVSPNSK